MSWDSLAASVNRNVIRAFQSAQNPTVSYSPRTGGGPYTIPAVERELGTPEPTSSGSQTSFFFHLADFQSAGAPPPSIGDSLSWKSSTFRVQNVEADSDGGVRVMVRKAG